MLGLLHVDENRPEAADVALKRYLGLVQDQPNPSQRGMAQAHLGLAQSLTHRIPKDRPPSAQSWP